MRGTNARMPCSTPQRLTPSTHSQSPNSRCQVIPPWNTPALLHSRWTEPKRSYARAARASTCSGRDTSVGATTTSAPAVSTSAAASSSALTSTSAMTTRMPSPAARRASARPIPLPAPVTTATRPSNCSMRLRRSAAVDVAVADRLALGVERRERRVDLVGSPALADVEVPVDAGALDHVDHSPVHDEHLARDLGGGRRRQVADEWRHVLGRELIEVGVGLFEARERLGHAGA